MSDPRFHRSNGPHGYGAMLLNCEDSGSARRMIRGGRSPNPQQPGLRARTAAGVAAPRDGIRARKPEVSRGALLKKERPFGLLAPFTWAAGLWAGLVLAAGRSSPMRLGAAAFLALGASAFVAPAHAQTTCSAPTLTGRTVIATATVTVGSRTLSPRIDYGYQDGNFGSLSGDTSFMIGSNSYTIAEAYVSEGGSNSGWFSFRLGGRALLPASDSARLQLHVCDATFEAINFNSYEDFFNPPSHRLEFYNSGLDWSSETSRTLRVSVPTANVPAALVSNFGQDIYSDNDTQNPRAMRFSTGSNPAGYTLSSIGVITRETDGIAFTATVCRATSAGLPPVAANQIATHHACLPLNPPTSFPLGFLTFTAPPRSFLAPDTDYTVVFLHPNGRVFYAATESTSEDSGSEAGWTLGNRYDFYAGGFNGAGPWRASSTARAYFVAVRGSERSGTVSNAVTLSALSVSQGTLSPTFSPAHETYTLQLGRTVSRITVTATPTAQPTTTDLVGALFDGATVTYLDRDDQPLADADLTANGFQVDLGEFGKHIKVRVTAANGRNEKTYSLRLRRGAGTRPTVANAIPNQSAQLGVPFSYTFPEDTFADADGDTLTYRAIGSENRTLGDDVLIAGSGGKKRPGWIKFDASTRTFSGTPPPGSGVTTRVWVTAHDETGQSVSTSFSIAVAVEPGLVGNLAQPVTVHRRLDWCDHAQKFTTGSHAAGYTVTSVDVWLSGVHTSANLPAVVIRTVESGGGHGSAVGTLEAPASGATGSGKLYRFTASASLVLTASTTYVLTFEGGSANVWSTGWRLRDPGSAAGWSLAAKTQRRCYPGRYGYPDSYGDSPNTSTTTLRINGATGAMSQEVVEAPVVVGAPTFGGDTTWSEGDNVDVTVTFSEAVEVDTTGGMPSIGVVLGGPGGSARSAEYESGSGTTDLLFRYALVKGDGSHDSMEARGNSLATNGGTIRSVATRTSAALEHEAALDFRIRERGTGPEETLPSVSIAASATPVTEGEAAAFTLSRTGDADAALTVAVSVSETGAVVSGTPPAEVEFAEDAASVTLRVATEDDEAVEGASTVAAAVASGAGYSVDGASGSAEVVVQDDDARPEVTTASPIEVAEGATAVATLTATDVDTPAGQLAWSIPAGGAGGADGSAFEVTAQGTLSFRAAKDFEAPDDANRDRDYQVTVRVTDGANPVDVPLVVRLTDVDEAPPAFSSATVDGASLVLTFDEALDGASAPAASAFAVTVGGETRAVEGVEVEGSAVTLTLASPVTSGNSVTVAYRAPTAPDPGLQDAAGNRVADIASTQVTNQTAAALPTVSIAASKTPVTEGAAADFRLSRTGDAAAALTVAVAVSETGTAVSATPPTEVAFAEGAASATLSVPTVDDEAVEDASTVTAAVSPGAGYSVDGTSGSAEVLVQDDDAAPEVTTASPIEVAEGATAVATLTATDVDTPAGQLAWSIPAGGAGGADGAAFEVTARGSLSFRAAKDFEAPDDANRDKDYQVTLRVTDGANPVDVPFVVRLTDVDEAPGQVTGLTVTAQEESLSVTWTEVDGADGYRVQWREDGESYDAAARESTVPGGLTSETINELEAGTLHWVRGGGDQVRHGRWPLVGGGVWHPAGVDGGVRGGRPAACRGRGAPRRARGDLLRRSVGDGVRRLLGAYRREGGVPTAGLRERGERVAAGPFRRGRRPNLDGRRAVHRERDGTRGLPLPRLGRAQLQAQRRRRRGVRDRDQRGRRRKPRPEAAGLRRERTRRGDLRGCGRNAARGRCDAGRGRGRRAGRVRGVRARGARLDRPQAGRSLRHRTADRPARSPASRQRGGGPLTAGGPGRAARAGPVGQRVHRPMAAGGAFGAAAAGPVRQCGHGPLTASGPRSAVSAGAGRQLCCGSVAAGQAAGAGAAACVAQFHRRPVAAGRAGRVAGAGAVGQPGGGRLASLTAARP